MILYHSEEGMQPVVLGLFVHGRACESATIAAGMT
jgi:hypothetical protein